jgi:hypothetical protein
VAHMLPADSAHSVLTCCTLCRKLLRGRIVESKNIPHTIDVGSLSRSCDSPAGRGYAREVVARGRSRSVLRPCSAHMAQMPDVPQRARLIFRMLHAHGLGLLGSITAPATVMQGTHHVWPIPSVPVLAWFLYMVRIASATETKYS